MEMNALSSDQRQYLQQLNARCMTIERQVTREALALFAHEQWCLPGRRGRRGTQRPTRSQTSGLLADTARADGPRTFPLNPAVPRRKRSLTSDP